MPTQPARPGVARGTAGPGQPVFVDRTGRRRHLALLAGFGLGAGLLVSLALILAGLFTGSPMPLPGWPDPGGRQRPDGPVAEMLGKSPSAAPGRQITPAGAPTRSPAPPPAPTVPASQPASPQHAVPSVAATTPGDPGQPGQGEEHRATPAGRASKSPGKPG